MILRIGTPRADRRTRSGDPSASPDRPAGVTPGEFSGAGRKPAPGKAGSLHHNRRMGAAVRRRRSRVVRMIVASDVTHHYGVRPVLRGIDLRVERGELVVVL